MSIELPSVILLAIVIVATWAVAGPVSNRIKMLERNFTADEIRDFRERFAKRSDRAEMPAKFDNYAALKDRMGRIWITAVFATITALIAIIYLGSDLGLSRGE